MIAAHMVGDYLLQTDNMARNKFSDKSVRLLHCGAYMLPVFLVGYVHAVSPWGLALFYVVNLIAHFVIDSRRWASGDKWPPKPILVDQALHLVTLAFTARLLTI